jgi:hypothetical protein
MRLAIQTATTTANSTMSPFTTHLPYGVTVREQPMPVNLPVVQCPNLLPCSLASENRAPEWARQSRFLSSAAITIGDLWRNIAVPSGVARRSYSEIVVSTVCNLTAPTFYGFPTRD